VYERRSALGGKAASVRRNIDGASVGGDGPGFPGEHGFRFFPGWYRHVRDTLRRIPIGGRRDSAREHVVSDHLVATARNVVLQYERAPVPIVLHVPRTTQQLQALVDFARQLFAMGLPVTDLVAFLKELARFLRMPDAERQSAYDARSWWDLLDVKNRSPAFRTLTLATTRTLLAAKAEKASAYTIALMAIRTLFGAPLGADHVLDGPTSEVWIRPWELYLRGRGVRFELDHELDSIRFRGDAPQIESLRFTKPTFAGHALAQVLRMPDGTNAEELKKAEATLAGVVNGIGAGRFADALGKETPGDPPVDQAGALTAAKLREQAVVARRLLVDPAPVDVSADYYVFALPVEQMAYYVNRSTTAQSYDPSLARIVRLSGDVDWMAGIQFYLRYPVRLTPGHVVCVDTEWALTAVEHTQFWKDVLLPEGVQSVLSVDISEWDRPGRYLRKPAFLCTRLEIATEVWEQLKASFNRRGGTDVLRNDALFNGEVDKSFHLDDSIVERFDRKKQAAFVRGLDRALARRSDPSSPPAIATTLTTTALESDVLEEQATQSVDLPFVFGDRLELNVEPLLVNRPGSIALRPTADTEIGNMFLAADYVYTTTNLASMEGANEAARRAVNAILEVSGSKYEPCQLFAFEDAEVLPTLTALLAFAERLPAARESAQAATRAISAAGAFAAQTTETLARLWRNNDNR
jgi:uncharacterized protein with NAD-binding domain and iron-sulfur cluster